MNAAILLMATAATAGQPAPPPPPVVQVGHAAPAGCGDCGPVDNGCDVSCSRVGFFEKLKSRMHSRKAKCGCDAAPACDNCAPPAPPPPPPPPPPPAPACCEPPPCNDCHAPRVSILDRLRAKFKKKSHCDDCAAPAPACEGCGAAPAPAPHPAPAGGGVAPAPTPTPTPAPMPPRPTTPPKAEVTAPGVVTPVSGPRLTGTTNPY